ncbi:radical SAM protein [Candidatus Halobeggiatoa sp. HSG11]|nr:radical SAM protein [Candidatus Halobeggiatoa sp. HSG11]
MNHLIVVPRIVNNIGDWYQLPLGIAYISSSLEKAGFTLFKLNLNTIAGSVHDILSNVIAKHNINTVLTGGLTGQYGAIRDIAKETKLINKDIKTIVGGGIITSAPEHAMEALEYADYGVIGEGEIICCELLETIENNLPIEKVISIVYLKNDSYIVTPGKPATVDVKTLPFPDYKGLEFDKLVKSVPNTLGMCEYNTLPIVTSRSCPYKCTFCFHSSGQKFRQRDLDSVFAEIDYLANEFGVKYLSIQDELFGLKKKRIKEFCDRIKNYNIQWLANFRVTDITPELIAMLKEANCATVAFGIESADNSVLKSMNKRITIEDTERALELVYNAGLGIQGVFIFGDIAETVETATRTFNWWKQHIKYELQLSAIITYPGTELYKYALREKIIKDPVQYIKDGCPLVRLSKHMTDEDYKWLFEQLASLPRMLHNLPNQVQVTNIDYEHGNIDVTGNCVTCDTANKWEKSRLFVLETLVCKSCGRRHIAPIPKPVTDIISSNIDKLIDKYGKVAFWGVNSYFYKLSEQLNIKQYDKLFFIDQSDVRCGLKILKHTIQCPDVIMEENIKCVVVSVVQYFSILKQPIEDDYQQEKVMSISELLSDIDNI